MFRHLPVLLSAAAFLLSLGWAAAAQAPEPGRIFMKDGRVLARDDDHAVLVVSEKLTDVPEWTLIPNNHLVMVEQNLNVRVRPIKT